MSAASSPDPTLYTLATVEQLSGWLGEPIEGAMDRDRAGWALAAATGLVLDHTGQDETAWDAKTAPARVVQVVLACAARAWTNPENWQYESVDDWRAGGRPVDEAGLYLTASERRVLQAFTKAPQARGLGVVRLERDVWPSVRVDPVADAILHGGA